MGDVIGRALARMGFTDCQAARDEDAGIYSLPTIARERLWRRFERKRRTSAEIRADMRAVLITLGRLIADPDNAWRRDDLESDRRTRLSRYRTLLVEMRRERRPELPGSRRDSDFLSAAE